ncbi:MAG: GntR family transcriptional regulator [Rhodobacteraceae bacterium]|nr:GntR family transcriptional regulator [Paracoccaceae bacterium]
MTEPDRPSYRVLKAEFLRRIRARVWPPGALIPGELELAAEFGCARATINRALTELAEEGVIDRRRRAGTRVKLSPVRQARFEIPIVRAEVEATGAVYRYALVGRAVGAAPDWLRALRDLPEGARMLHLICMHYADDRPFQHEERWINIAAVPEVATADFSAVGPNEWLVQAVPFTDAEISFSATAAEPRLAEFLAVAPDEPVMLAERTTWLEGQLVTHVRMHFGRGYRLTTRY